MRYKVSKIIIDYAFRLLIVLRILVHFSNYHKEFNITIEVYYYSGTVNSLHVAKELQKRIPEIKLISIISLLYRESFETEGETVGFVFPQYASTIPKMVAKFLKKLDLNSAEYLFAIATRGGTECRAFIDIDRIIKRNAKKLNSCFVINMPGSSLPLLKDFSNLAKGSYVLFMLGMFQFLSRTIDSNKVKMVYQIIYGKEWKISSSRGNSE